MSSKPKKREFGQQTDKTESPQRSRPTSKRRVAVDPPQPFPLPADSTVGKMLYKIVENEYKPPSGPTGDINFDQKDWSESALFEFAYTKT